MGQWGGGGEDRVVSSTLRVERDQRGGKSSVNGVGLGVSQILRKCKEK